MNKNSHNVPAGASWNTAREHLDSYATWEEMAESGALLCRRCGARHYKKRWYTSAWSYAMKLPDDIVETLCPGCYRVENGISNGVVVLAGVAPPCEVHRAIMMLVKHIETECWRENPFSQIVDTTEQDGDVLIRTTTAWLAKRIGNELHGAFDGKLEVKMSPDNQSLSVRWEVPSKNS